MGEPLLAEIEKVVDLATSELKKQKRSRRR